jgi:hypothetical protein
MTAHSQLTMVLCDLNGGQGFEGLLAANVNLDQLGLGFRLLGKINLQHALIIVGAHLLGIYGTRQRERASQASVLSFDAKEPGKNSERVNTVIKLSLFLRYAKRK